MAEDYKNAFDYYNAEPPKEGASLPPEDACMPAPDDEYNENVHGTDYVKRTSGSARSAALALVVGTLAVSFFISGGGTAPVPGDITVASSVTQTTDDKGIDPTVSVAETTPAPTPTPAPSPTPTPIPKATEDLSVRLDSLQMYQLSKGFLAEVSFTLRTNIGTDVTSITGSLDSNLFKYDGYNAKKRKMKYHYEKYHQDFTMDPSCVEKGDSINPYEKQYKLMLKVPIDASSEDNFNVTLTVSNTLNGEKTEDKTVTLKDVGIWNEQTNSYTGTMYTISVTKNADKTFDVTLKPKYDDVPISNPTIGGISFFPKSGSSYFTNKDFKVTRDGNSFHIEFKNPKKAPAKGMLSFTTFADFETTDSTGTKIKDSAYGHFSKNY